MDPTEGIDATTENEDQLTYDLANSLLIECKQAGQLSALENAIYLFREALALRPAPHPHRSESLNLLATALMTRFNWTRQIADLDEVIKLYNEILEQWRSTRKSASETIYGCTFNGHRHSRRDAVIESHDQSSEMTDLAFGILTEFHRAPDISSLNLSICLHRDALRLRGPSHTKCSVSLTGLADALVVRFHLTGLLQDVYEAVSLHREALRLRPASHLERLSSLLALAAALVMRFSQTGQPRDLLSAISLRRNAREVGTDIVEVYGLGYRAAGLLDEFNRSGRVSDLQGAVWLYRQTLVLLSAHDSNRLKFIINLASTLTTRFARLGQRVDLHEAVALNRDVLGLLPDAHPDRSTVLNNLANTLDMRYNQTAQRVDLDEALSLHRAALRLRPAHHPDRSMSLTNLASALGTLFSLTGQQKDLDEAVQLHREAVALRPAPHPARPRSLNNLANALDTRFSQTGRLDDLDKAISFHREALNLLSASHPDRPSSLNNLAIALVTRFDQMGQRNDLNEAILLHRAALLLQPVPHPSRSGSLVNLASALSKRSHITGQLGGLDQAVVLLREAVMLLPAPHPDRPRSLYSLAIALDRRFSRRGQLDDLNEAVLLHREVLTLRPPAHADRAMSLNQLAFVLSKQFGFAHRLSDLEEAIAACRESLHMLPSDHPEICAYSRNLGDILMSMYSQTGQSNHLVDAMASFRVAVACESASASRRFAAARRWAVCADSNKHPSALEAYKATIQLLPRLAMLGLDLQSRQQVLTKTSGSDSLARDAAACAIRSGQFAQAVELLEEGRTVFWSQALQLRTPLDDLRAVEPKLAQKLQDISRVLEQGSFREVSSSMMKNSQDVMSMEAEAVHYRHCNDDWLATLAEIRSLKGFHDFMQPKKLATLLRAASHGPVIILNASRSACDALKLTSSGVEYIPLADFTFADAEILVQSVQSASYGGISLPQSSQASLDALVEKTHTSFRDIPLALPDRHLKVGRHKIKRSSKKPDHIFRDLLAILWTFVVEPVVRSLKLEKSQSPPRLWWCSTGPFAFLPVHAAGIYNVKGSLRSAFDHMVSSYTPALNFLLAPTPLNTDPFKMLVVIQPKALPHTREELRKIEGHVPSQFLVKLGVVGAPSSKEVVLANLRDVSIAHFACHGRQDLKRPLESAVLLEDGPLEVSRIMAQPMPNASLAFLCACQTATGDSTLPDEAIHIAATMLFGGFRGVVATLWSIHDEDGPKIADSFYGELLRDKVPSFMPDITQAARALHLAVLKLRAENHSTDCWTPYVLHLVVLEDTRQYDPRVVHQPPYTSYAPASWFTPTDVHDLRSDIIGTDDTPFNGSDTANS
ncbi:hypothetical protein EW146_g4607 [Bondarzewia mesenterica]|uniref:CHAT domain-containing protein n=1 Tax=Bondarzewia mesenterica TaxID=1095465 RepID=A0A4S4LW63_9AGAM|nr:hypothetical protein EW146_g4607 [Bondarzewia mesenterica]